MNENDDEKETLGLTIRQAREELGLTQDMLARSLGVTTQTVSRWERGVSGPRGPRQKMDLVTTLGGASTVGVIGQVLGIGVVALGIAKTIKETITETKRAEELAELRATIAMLQTRLEKLQRDEE